MQPYHYPRQTLIMDGVRALVGLALTLGPLFLLAPGWPLTIILSGLSCIFLWFGCRLLVQGMMSITPSADGLFISGIRQRFFGWKDLTALKLAYYAPVRRRRAGWYRLTLVGKQGRIGVESTMEGFDDLLRSALAAANREKLILDPSTHENLATWAGQSDVSLAKSNSVTSG